MAPDKPNHHERIFHEALQRPSPGERTAYLDGACGEDLHLRATVDALLQAHTESSEFLEQPLVNADKAAMSEGPGSRIGNFKLLQEIGEGGMGVVYMAEQEKPVRRKVALKIIKLGMDTKQVIARFEAERQALAMMDHPNIAKVLGADATETGRPYFVMELVRGIAISDYCDTHNLSTRERLELFVDVCHAIQHAHLKGIIHRDIKPSNVLVTSHDGRPVPKIIDFGVAKATNQRLTEMTLFTEFQQFIGTPEYMSPEQAEMSGLDIDTRTDVYSLGVLLYHLLTGTTPVDAKTLREAGYQGMQRLIREKEATAPSTLIGKMGPASTEIAKHRGTQPSALESLIRGDLDWIVMKSLEKDRTRRYETVAALADDVERHLGNMPVLAGRPSAIYRLNKFVRRNKVTVAAGLIAASAILIGLAAAVTGFVSARAEAARSQQISDALQEILAAADPGRAASLDVDVESVLETAREAFGDTHATVAAAVNSLAVQLHNAGDFAGAEPLYQESARIWEGIYGKESLNVALTLGRLGDVLRSQGKVEPAEAALREALGILESIPGEPDIASCPIRVELAQLLDGRGEREAAAELFRQAIAIYRTDEEAYRFQLMQTLEQYLVALLSSQDDEQAYEVLLEIYAQVRLAYEDGSAYHVTSAVGLANWLHQRGRSEESEPYFREVLEYTAADPGTQQMYRIIALDRLFQILRSRRDPEGAAEADAILVEVIDFLEDSWTAAEIVNNLNHLAERLASRGLHAEAIEPAARAVRIAREKMDQRAVNNLSNELLETVMRVSISAELDGEVYERALQGTTELLEVRADDSAFVVARGAILFRLGRVEEADGLYSGIETDNNVRYDAVAPVKLAFHALIAHRRGETEAAGRYFTELIEIEAGSHRLDDETLRPLIAEVRETLDLHD